MLDRIDLFDDIDLPVLNTLARQSEECDFDEGTALVEADQSEPAFYLLLEGAVEVRLNDSGSTRVEAQSEANYVASGPLMCPQSPQTVSVVAASPVKALVIKGNTIRNLCRDNMRVRYAMDRLHTQRLSEAS